MQTSPFNPGLVEVHARSVPASVDSVIAGEARASGLTDPVVRTDLLNRLRRAEGQLRGIQRMIADGENGLAVAGQLSAVRKALESASERMTVCLLEQRLTRHLGGGALARGEISDAVEELQTLLARLR